MNKYAKLINENEIEYAPKNKANIINYNQNIEAMIKDGFMKIIKANVPLNDNEYNAKYRIEDNQIIESFEEITPNYIQLRKTEYPELGDMIDAFCKAESGEKEELNYLLNKRKQIKSKYPKA